MAKQQQAKQEPAPKGNPIELKRAYVQAVKADFVKRDVKITISIPLDDNALELRERLAFLAWVPEDNPCTMSIQPVQQRLFD